MDKKKYLKYVMLLEQELYTLDKSIAYMQSEERGLGIRKNFEEPKKPEKVGVFDIIGALIYFGGITGGIGFPISIIYAIIKWIYTGAKFGSSFWGCIIIFIGIGMIIGLFVSISSGDKSQYYRDLNQYDKSVDRDKQRVDKELKLKQNLNLQIDALSQKKQELSNTLQKMYSYNILYPKYRNFVAVATFYEYFDSGRCSALEGHEGAYNIFENEIRLNAILTKLDDINERLDEIRTNQYKVYNAVSEGNRIANNIYQQSLKITGSTETIANNSAIAAYNSRIVAENIEILKFMEN